jgi:hypothetical protein
MPIFPSVEWLQAVAQIVGADDGYRKYGRFDAIVGLRVGDLLYSVTFDVFDIKDIHETSEEELRDADFVLEMSYAQWIDLIENIQQHGKADLEHTLNSLDLRLPDGLARNTTGDGYRHDKFFRFNESLQRFFDDSAQVPTEFLSEAATARAVG